MSVNRKFNQSFLPHTLPTCVYKVWPHSLIYIADCKSCCKWLIWLTWLMSRYSTIREYCLFPDVTNEKNDLQIVLVDGNVYMFISCFLTHLAWIVHILSVHQFTQEGINRNLVTWLNGDSRLFTYPMYQAMFVLHWADVTHGHCSADLHCLLRCGKQNSITGYGMYVTLADFVAPKASERIIHYLPTVVYFINQVMRSGKVRKIHVLPSPGRWPHLGFLWLYLTSWGDM